MLKKTEQCGVRDKRQPEAFFGRVQDERIVLNEESVWSRNGTNTNRPCGHQYTDQIRSLLFAEKYVEANKLIVHRKLKGVV